MSLLLLQFLLLLLSSIVITGTNAQDCAANGVCDGHPRCPVWKQEGECTKSAGYMKKHCRVSCGYAATAINKSQTAVELMEESTQFGVKQEAVGESTEQTLDVISKSIEYMKEPRDVHFCKNKHEHCSFWATVGTFYLHLIYIFVVACELYHCVGLLDFKATWPIHVNATVSGDLNLEKRINLLKLIRCCSHTYMILQCFLKLCCRRM